MAFLLDDHLLTFIDSFQFMNSSLAKLASNLPKEAFKYTSEEFVGKKFHLITLYNVCAVPWGLISTVEDVQYRGGSHEYRGGYLEYRGGCSVPWGYHDKCGGYHEYRGGCSIP